MKALCGPSNPRQASESRRVGLQNIRHPGPLRSVDADMYKVMKGAFPKTLPKAPPGLTVDQIDEALLVHLPQSLLPAGAKKLAGG